MKTAVLTFAIAVAMATAASASAATLRFINNTSAYVTLSLNGAYGCNTAPFTTCTIPVAPGSYHLRACTADGRCTGAQAYIDEAGFEYTVTEN